MARRGPTLQPSRTYYLEDIERAAITWVDTIQQVLRVNRIG